MPTDLRNRQRLQLFLVAQGGGTSLSGLEAQVRKVAGQVPGIIGLDKCFVRKMGFYFYIDLHIVVEGDLSVREGHGLSHTVENEIVRALPQVAAVLVHVEPAEELMVKTDQTQG